MKQLLGLAVLLAVIFAGSSLAQKKKELVAKEDGAILLDGAFNELAFLDSFLPPQESIFRFNKSFIFHAQNTLYFHRGLSFDDSSPLLHSPYLGQSWCKVSFENATALQSDFSLAKNASFRIGSYNKKERNLPLTNAMGIKVAELSCMISQQNNSIAVGVVPSLAVLQKAFEGSVELQLPGIAKIFHKTTNQIR